MTKFHFNGVTYSSKMEFFKSISPMDPNENYKTYYLRMCIKYIPGYKERYNMNLARYMKQRYNSDEQFRQTRLNIQKIYTFKKQQLISAH